ncbi:MAG: hypothetical protein WD342_15320 [Verrucomicrobiales bacterium]
MAVSCFVAVGNAQDAETATATGAASYNGTQGNVAANRSLRDAEMNRAVQEARQKKALMAAMASQSLTELTVPTTAEAFLAANRPAPMTSSEREARMTDASRRSYVPEFEDAPAASTGADRYVRPERPGRGNPYEADATPDGDSDPPAPAGPTPEEVAARETATMEAVVAPERAGAVDGEKPGLFARLFGRNKSRSSPSAERAGAEPQRALPSEPVESLPSVEPTEVAESTEPEMVGSTEQAEPAPVAAREEEPPSEVAEEAPEEVATAPIFQSEPEAPSASSPEPEVAPIFTRRSGSNRVAGDSATVKATTQAEVGGVLVTLYEGAEVGVLSREGNTATIRLPDRRVGVVPSSALVR